MNKIQFGLRLRKLREQKNLTQAEFAEMIDMNFKSLSRIEVGYNYPSMETLQSIAKALNVSVGYLVAPEDALDKAIYIEEISHQIQNMELYDIQSIFEFIQLYNSRREAILADIKDK